MVWWVVLAIQVGLQFVSGLLSQPKNAKPEDRPKIPEIDTTKPIPVAWGECLIEGAMLMDYFDFKTKPIKIRNPGTFFLTSITVGYQYFLGMVFGLCWGTWGCKLLAIHIENRVVWNGTFTFLEESGPNLFNQIDPLAFYKPSFFGSEKQEGGVWANCTFYQGVDLSGSGVPLVADAYWAAQRGMAMPHYLDLCYLVWHGPSHGNVALSELFSVVGARQSGYIGNSPNLWQIAFKLRRQPLWASTGVTGRLTDDPGISGGNHANPVSCLMECLVDTNWGMGIPAAQIQRGGDHDFDTAAFTVFQEGMAFSYLWTSTSKVEDMIAEILRFIDGAIWTDVQTGKIKIKLVRDDFNPDSLPELNNDDLIEIQSFTRGSWEDTKNEVRVSFPDHSKPDFGESTAYWYSNANKLITGVTEAAEISFRGCPTMKLANRLAAREGRALSTPLARGKIVVDRRAWDWHPAKPFKFTWPEQGVSGLICRVTNIDLGTVLDGRITIDFVEDVFAVGPQTVAAPAPTVWTDPIGGAALNAIAPEIGEIPYWFQRDDVARVFGVAGRPSAAHLSYDGAIDGQADALETEFTPTGTLQAVYPQVSTGDYDTTGFTIASMVDPAEVIAGTTTTIATEGVSLALIGDPSGDHEWIAFESVTSTSTTVTLDNVWRGLLDTPPLSHAAGTRVYFFSAGSALFSKAIGAGQSVSFKALTRTMRDQLRLDQATGASVVIQQRALRPLPPHHVTLAGSYTNERQDTGDVVLAWREHSRLTLLQVIRQSAATETPEPGVTYEVEVHGTIGTLLRSVTGLVSPAYTYTNAFELSDTGASELQAHLLFKIYSRRSGLRSAYPWNRHVYRVDPATFENVVTVDGLVVTVDGAIVTQS